MPHQTPLTESQTRHVDEYRNEDVTTYEDMEFEGQARHVDEYRLAKLHEAEEESS